MKELVLVRSSRKERRSRRNVMFNRKRKMIFEGIIGASGIRGEEFNKISESIGRETVVEPDASERAKKGTAKMMLTPVLNKMGRSGRVFDNLSKTDCKGIENATVSKVREIRRDRGTGREDLKDDINFSKVDDRLGSQRGDRSSNR